MLKTASLSSQSLSGSSPVHTELICGLHLSTTGQKARLVVMINCKGTVQVPETGGCPPYDHQRKEEPTWLDRLHQYIFSPSPSFSPSLPLSIFSPLLPFSSSPPPYLLPVPIPSDQEREKQCGRVQSPPHQSPRVT